MRDGRTHQFVISRVVLDLVDPMSVTVMGVQDRAISIGQVAPFLRLGGARDRSELGDLVRLPIPRPPAQAPRRSPARSPGCDRSAVEPGW